jgi:hypothetical protein
VENKQFKNLIIQLPRVAKYSQLVKKFLFHCVQVRDFMVFIEAQKMLETSANGAEIRDGSVLVLPATPTPSKPSSRTLRSGKKKK